MRILIDIQTLYSPEKNRGIGIYTYNWTKNFIKQDSSHRYYLMRKSNDNWEFAFVSNFIDIDYCIRNDQNWEIYQLEDFLQQKNIDIIHFTSPHMFDIDVPEITNNKVMKSYLVYDLIPIVMKEHYYNNWPQQIQQLYDLRCNLVKNADSILTISEASKKDLMKYYQINAERIHVIYASTNEDLYQPIHSGYERELINKEIGISSPFIYSLTGYDPRKNNKGLINSFSQVIKERPDLKLVISGIKQEAEKEELQTYAQNNGISKEQIEFLGFVSDDTLIALYKECEVFVFPSIYEGFGLPVLEAMRCGTPVITINSSSLPEVAGDAALLVESNDSEAMAEAILAFTNNKNLSDTYKTMGINQANKFSWNKTALDSLKVFEKLTNNFSEITESDKSELAFFSPLNPQPSGISDYSEELLTKLSAYYDIKIFVNDFIPENTYLLQNFEILEYKENRARLEKIKLRLYHMGNNELHSWIYNALVDYPGSVVLHDLNLYGFYMYTQYLRGNKNGFVNELRYSHGQRGQAAGEQLMQSSTYPNDQEFPMFKKVVELSNQVIVHSQWVKNKIDIEADFKGEIKVIPSGILIEDIITSKDDLKKSLGLNLDKIAIGIFGNVIPNKRIDVILRVVSQLVKTNINIEIYFVGHCSNDMKETINKTSKQLKINNFIKLVSSPDLDIFKKYIEASDICINLRWPTFGETSATLTRSLGFGVPCIVSNVGSYKEYPDDCVWKVDVDEYEEDLLLAYLLELINNKALRQEMGQKAQLYIKNNHDFEIVSNMIYEILI
ncbi:glycosyltransferase [Paenibacillus cremeus]|uniref:Glycosyltransferase n=1 Tax=Paenibacillus cremeus TaxID=2163881 RepID=A0A559KCD4_9BACL|nr:glycosyltransferase [Paenibacillus cremeus]TVY09781.1 glycosyltransferase [Paenibacillus cremeus]